MQPSNVTKAAANRVLLLCSSINDRTIWPYWKFLQMKRVPGVKDMSILAFNSQGGSFEARIEGDKYTLKKYDQVTGYKQDMLERFIHQWHDAGRSYFVYGGHGMGDYIDLEQGTVSLQMHELASILGRRQFEAIVFDACFMANLDCAYHLRHNTKYIGACEGYMWEPDHIASRHILNQRTAALMSRLGNDPRRVLEQVQRSYCRHSPFADFSVLDTSGIEDLKRYVEQHVIPRVYDRAAFYNDPQLERLAVIGAKTLRQCEAIYNWESSAGQEDNSAESPSSATEGGEEEPHYACVNGRYVKNLHSAVDPSSFDLHLPPVHQFTPERVRMMRAAQLEHSLYPSFVDDKHLIDLRSYLLDMAREEAAESAQKATSGGGAALPVLMGASTTPVTKAGCDTSSSALAQFGRSVTFPRTWNVNLHGAMRPPMSLTSLVSPTSTEPLLTSPSSGRSVSLPPPRMSSSSMVLRGSAREGLQLLDRVVVSHRGPRAKPLYASKLGGLSLTVHEFSAHSKPLQPWPLSATARAAFDAKVQRFLREGCMQEVHLPAEPEIARVLRKRSSPRTRSSTTHTVIRATGSKVSTVAETTRTGRRVQKGSSSAQVASPSVMQSAAVRVPTPKKKIISRAASGRPLPQSRLSRLSPPLTRRVAKVATIVRPWSSIPEAEAKVVV